MAKGMLPPRIQKKAASTVKPVAKPKKKAAKKAGKKMLGY